MIAVSGPISDRLRAQYAPDAPEWNPTRVTAQTGDMPADAYDGIELGGSWPRREAKQ